MRLFILDAGLSEPDAHNFAFALSVGKEAQRRGLECVALASKHLQPSADLPFTVEPLFSRSYYDRTGHDPVSGPMKSYAELNALFADELDAFPRTAFTANDVIWVPTISERHLKGLIAWYRAFGPGAPMLAISLVLPCGVVVDGQEVVIHDSLKAYLYRTLLGAITRLPPTVHLMAYGAQAAHNYRLIAQRPVPEQPLLVDFEDGPIAEPANQSVLLHVGGARARKGSHMLPEMVRRLAEWAPDWQWIVHANAGASGDGDDVLAELRRLDRESLELSEGHLGPDAYRQLFLRARLVLMPYDSQYYLQASSGVLWDAIAYGRPVVVPAGSGLEREAQAWGASCAGIATSNPEEIARGLAAVLDERRWDDAMSRQAGDRFRSANGARRFVDHLLALGR